ncbi:hypothetical protein KUH03_27255 [Sphingobacterium sp. E70]|uniref:hypothetical protein n=1 Tax=Sphingobacterium sp. E70 TaxID=2853439 RepID=UPI00211BB254|nr:hypothetical protein [Sphingobacterium sp. E70]ULT22946.1 hypothetical protein KUH03_27255 [Sphingobacterium sp. E70]
MKRYIFDPSTEEDQPLITMTSQLNGLGYGNNAYIKAALSYIALRDYLGDAVFKKHYIIIWIFGMVNTQRHGISFTVSMPELVRI